MAANLPERRHHFVRCNRLTAFSTTDVRLSRICHRRQWLPSRIRKYTVAFPGLYASSQLLSGTVHSTTRLSTRILSLLYRSELSSFPTRVHNFSYPSELSSTPTRAMDPRGDRMRSPHPWHDLSPSQTAMQKHLEYQLPRFPLLRGLSPHCCRLSHRALKDDILVSSVDDCLGRLRNTAHPLVFVWFVVSSRG
jgi:hypothetical protein